MQVTVCPDTFTLVEFDAAEIAAIFSDVGARLGLAEDLVVTINVDESTPLAGVAIASVDPPVLEIEGGALEAARYPRRLNPRGSAVVAARLLGRVRDRRDPNFGEPPAEDALSIPEADAWDAYLLGRAQRAGIEVFRPRWQYRFRNRHGFSDVSDRVFDRLWTADTLSWADLAAACAETAAARAGASA